MSSILPKGIVVNTPQISGDIQKIDREPLAIEEIAKLWKVYTTTKRRLLDPTAERLENYWWRIWGSRKRNLRGATVARIFADISDGISFVPLLGPANRDESGGRPTTSLIRGSTTASTTEIHSRPESDSSNGQYSSIVLKNSAARPPPILKKTTGPSGTGPRPTARFISPHTSEEEEEKGEEDEGGGVEGEGEEATQASPTTSLGAHVVVRPPTPDSQISKDEKKAESLAGPRSKAHGIIGTAAAHKRRSGVNRRPNLDSSARAQESPPGSSNKDICRSVSEKPKQSKDSRDQALLPADDRLSTKNLKKSRSGKSSHSKVSLRQSSASRHDKELGFTMNSRIDGSQGEAESSNTARSNGKMQGYAIQGLETGGRETGLRGYEIERNEISLQSKRPELPLATSDQDREASVTTHYPLTDIDAKGATSVPPTYAVTIGKTSLQSKNRFVTAEDDGSASLGGSDKGIFTDRVEPATLFAKRPVQPVKSASALFGNTTRPSDDTLSRSKSQLTLLLEKDLAKDKQDRGGHDTASKPSDAKPR